MFCSCSELERMSVHHYIALLLHLEEATVESGPGISDVPDWLEIHRRKWPDVYFQVRRERSRGYSPLRSHLDTVSRKAHEPGLICSTKWINKGWLCGPWWAGELRSSSHTETHLHRKWPAAPHLHTWREEGLSRRIWPCHITSPPEEELASHICQQLFSHPSTAAHSTHTERTCPLKRIRMRSISDQPFGRPLKQSILV